MNLIQAIILGVVEGFTEFLPISSTFHLIFASKILGISQTEFQKLFEVFIQSGAILAVVFLFFNEVKKDFDLMKKVVVSFLPTAVIGLALYKVIKNVFFESNFLMLGMFVGMGVVFIVVEKIRVRNGRDRALEKLDYVQAILIGVFQALAVIPGVSRAGAVMVFMILLGFKRKESAKYSFLLAVPTIFSASAYDLWKMRAILTATTLGLFWQLIIGFFVSFVVSYFVIKWFIGFLQQKTLIPFGIYRIICGALLFFVR